MKSVLEFFPFEIGVKRKTAAVQTSHFHFACAGLLILGTCQTDEDLLGT